MLKILDLSDNMLGLFTSRIKVKTHVLRLRYDVALSCKLGYQHALVSDFLRFDMLVRSGIAQDRRNMDASLVGKGALPTYGWLTGILTLAISLIYRAVFVSVRRLSSPMHSYPSFSADSG